MRICPINNVNFCQLPFYQNGHIKVFKNFYYGISDKENSNYTASIIRNDEKYEEGYCIEFQDKDNDLEPVATDFLSIYPPNFIFVEAMRTRNEKRGYGLGSAMHLLSIAEMIENSIPISNLTSSAEAIAFHAKLGYRSNDDEWEHLKIFLEKISNDDDPECADISSIAEKISDSRDYSDRAKVILANKVINKYIDTVLKTRDKQELKNLFPLHLSMSLKLEDVLKNKDYYNDLFKKYDIDYTIE